jgi:hypothetical protein
MVLLMLLFDNLLPVLFLGMHRIPVLFLPDIRPAGYPANPKAGYRISGWISGKGWIPWCVKLINTVPVIIIIRVPIL